MAHESLINAGWQTVLERLGGSNRLEQEAREVQAFRRARGVKCAVDLLRLTLAYCLGTMGLRLTVAWAEAAGLASLSNVALLKRLRNMLPWLEVLVGRLLAGAGDGRCIPAAQGRLIRLVDATVVAKAGRVDREAGGVWRVHAVFDLPAERFSVFELTDEREGERFDRAAVIPGEIRLGDRAYLQPDRMATVLEGGADIVVRAKWNGARWLDADGGRFDLIELLKRECKDCLDRPIWIGRAGGAPLSLRLIAIRKPPEAAEKTRVRLLAKAREKQRVLQDATLVAAGWVILVTSLDATAFPAKAVGNLYRLRWRIEIAFKHLKSGAGLARPPGEDVNVAKAHILCHLLTILLTEPFLAEQFGDSPRREAA
jgi:hypothetical protein